MAILFRVKTTWANRGRTGETDDIVIAKNAIEALQRCWEPEDPDDLRTVEVEWLMPVSCIKIPEPLSVTNANHLGTFINQRD